MNRELGMDAKPSVSKQRNKITDRNRMVAA